MIKTLVTELSFSPSSVMSLHRWWKYIETAISLHVWTASKIPRWLRLSTEKSSTRRVRVRTHALSETSSRLARKHKRFLFPRTQSRHDSLEKCIKN